MGIEFYPVAIDEVIHTTDSAVLVDIDGEEIWIPKSALERDVIWSDMEIYVAEWFLNRKGIEY